MFSALTEQTRKSLICFTESNSLAVVADVNARNVRGAS
jgi:hypothetical protein